jgi:hypothetical protein
MTDPTPQQPIDDSPAAPDDAAPAAPADEGHADTIDPEQDVVDPDEFPPADEGDA